MSSLNRGPSIDASYQVLVHLVKRFQRRRYFRNQPIRNKNGLWRPCLLTYREEQVGIHFLIFFLANLAKGNMSFCHHLVSVVCRLPSVFFSHFNLLSQIGHSIDASYQVLVVAMFANRSGRNEQNREPSIDASYQVSVHLAKQFQKRRFLKIGQTCLFYTLQVGIHILILFLANLAKGNMSFCHHLVSVVCHPFTFHI
jgi:hypothetical protein